MIRPVLRAWDDLTHRKNLYLHAIEKQWDRSLIGILSDKIPTTPSENFLSRMAYLSKITSVDRALELLERARITRTRWKSVASVIVSDIVWAIDQIDAIDSGMCCPLFFVVVSYLVRIAY